MAENTVTRADLSEAVYQEVGSSRNESGILVESVLSEIADTLTRGETVKFPRSAASPFAKRPTYRAKSQTGQEVPILPRKVLVFRASNVLKSMINSGTGDNSIDGAALLTDGSVSGIIRKPPRSNPVTTFGTGSPFNQPGN